MRYLTQALSRSLNKCIKSPSIWGRWCPRCLSWLYCSKQWRSGELFRLAWVRMTTGWWKVISICIQRAFSDDMNNALHVISHQRLLVQRHDLGLISILTNTSNNTKCTDSPLFLFQSDNIHMLLCLPIACRDMPL